MKFDGEWYIAWYIFIGRKFRGSRREWSRASQAGHARRICDFDPNAAYSPRARNNFGFIPSTCPDVGAIQQRSCFPRHRQTLVMHPFSPTFPNSRKTLLPVVCLLPLLQVFPAHSSIRASLGSLCSVLSSLNHKSLTPSLDDVSNFCCSPCDMYAIDFSCRSDSRILIFANDRRAHREYHSAARRVRLL